LLKYKLYDIKYDIVIKNKSINRRKRLIIFGFEDNLKIINKHNINGFLPDTFKIIPAKLRPHKLFIIFGIYKRNKIPNIFTLILTQFTDHIIYNKIFDYLFINYESKPKILIKTL